MQVSTVPDGPSYSVSGMTTSPIAANIAVLSPLFLARLDPAAPVDYRVNITKIVVQWTTIAAFTTGVLPTRRLSVYRGSLAGGANGVQLTAVSKNVADASSEMNSTSGGDIRITSAGSALTTTATFETQEIFTIPLINANGAGFSLTQTIEFDTSLASPLVLSPGQLVAIRNATGLDTGSGTFELAVSMEWDES
jgi:hypothetical protein